VMRGDWSGADAHLGAEDYRAMYEYSPDGVLFTSPDGRILAANPAACEILGRSEQEICRLGRQRLMDHDDAHWEALLAERARTGRARGVARMIRGDGAKIEVEMR
jgi:PAS domain S-box-containing protein